MIRYSLKCGTGHQFDAWFSSSDSYDEQCEAEVIRCPECGSADVQKAPMAPAVLRGQRRAPARDEAPSPADGPLTEESFQRGPLDFVGNSILRWDGDRRTQLEFNVSERGWETNVGTVPEGSTWRKNPCAPHPRCFLFRLFFVLCIRIPCFGTEETGS